MHRTDPESGAIAEADAEAGRLHIAALRAALDTGDEALIMAAIDALERRFPDDEVIRDRVRALRAEIQFVAREAWRAVE